MDGGVTPHRGTPAFHGAAVSVCRSDGYTVHGYTPHDHGGAMTCAFPFSPGLRIGGERKAAVSNHDQDQALARAKKNAFSREKCEELRAIGMSLTVDDQPDEAAAALVEEAVELLLDVRQGFRGGRRNVRGSRHWEDI